jgi:hypothetical protein
MLKVLFIIFVSLATLFMAFLWWLSKDSKDSFAKKLRVLGYTGVVVGWALISFWS